MDGLTLADLDGSRVGVLPSQLLEQVVKEGFIAAEHEGIAPDQVQPASIDLRLGPEAWTLRCSFLSEGIRVADRIPDVALGPLNVDDGAVLLPGTPYLFRLMESLDLPPFLHAKANPKSSTGRADVFTRVITDHGGAFDHVRPSYRGPLYLEVVPLSFPVRVVPGMSLAQLRVAHGDASVSDEELRQFHRETPLVFTDGQAVSEDRLDLWRGLFLSLDLSGQFDGRGHRVGYCARRDAPALDLNAIGAHSASDYWTTVRRKGPERIILEAHRFYLLLTEQSLRIPPGLAAEMTAYDPTSGELRTHYAGFFDPGFGHPHDGGAPGSKVALEVRAHDVSFMIERFQRVCRFTFERMLSEPAKLYGRDIGSNYQGQVDSLGKHFRRDPAPPAADSHPTLFSDASPET